MTMDIEKKHLPLMGIGPIYVIIIVLLTLAGVFAKVFGALRIGYIVALRIPFSIVGILAIVLGILMWYKANVSSKLDENIKNNRLVTTGIYSWVRNPIYSAFLSLCTGILLMCYNLYLLVLPIIYWILLTILMINTEEKWLEDLYGEEYLDYKKSVNRCIPFPPYKRK